MSKGKCETQLEKMEVERNHWRDRARDLEHKLERAAMWESAFAGGVRHDMDSQIEKLQKDRDALIELFLRIDMFVNDATALAKENAITATELMSDTMNRLSEVEGQQGLSEIVSKIAGIYHVVFEPEIDKALIDMRDANDVIVRKLGIYNIWSFRNC